MCVCASPGARPSVVFLWGPHAGPLRTVPPRKQAASALKIGPKAPPREQGTCLQPVAKERPPEAPPGPPLQRSWCPWPRGSAVCPDWGGRQVARVLTFCLIALRAGAWTRWGHTELGHGCPKDHVTADLPAAPLQPLAGGAWPGTGQVRAVGG